MTKIYDRASQKLTGATDYQSVWLQRLYETAWGRCLLPLLTMPWFSKVYTWRDNTRLSKPKIAYFIKHYQLSMSEYETEHYKTFAEFFQRKFKKGIRTACSSKDVMAVADAKLLVLPISTQQTLDIKGQSYHFKDLVQDEALSREFEGGQVFIYRLGLEDYHRYWASETGPVVKQKRIKGKLHSVRAIAQSKYLIYKENQREYCVIETQDCGLVMQMEVGALTVGKINNLPTKRLKRAQEKGWFGLGGSTIIVAYQAQQVTVDSDIIAYSKQGIESQVQMGEKVGKKDVK